MSITLTFSSLKCLLTLYFFVVVSGIGFAQKQANVWHFGDGRCLDFSSGVPVNLPGSQISTFEGCASYSDQFGDLLFYTNGGGREPAFSGQDGGKIWNRNNAVMYDMQGVEGGGFSSRQSAVIFEAPGQSDVYYVFTMDEIEYTVGASPATNAAQPLGRGLRYFTVDMNQNGGVGAVVIADQPVYAPSAEGLCAIRHANKIDYWILINQDSTGIGVYSVTSSGVNFITNYTATGGGPGIIKVSPDGSKVRTGDYILDFNSSNGQLSNPVNLNAGAEFFEFSPNSRYMYEVSPIGGPIVVSRYDLQAASIPSSITTVGTINAAPGSVGGQMQTGPDGKIYFLEVNFPANTVTMHRINCPNTQTPSLELNLFPYTGYFIGLPNYPAWLFENYDSTYVSLGPDTVDLCDVGGSYVLDAQNQGATYLWSTGATTQTITVTNPGTYTVTVTGPCGVGRDELVIVNCNSSAPFPNCDTTGNWYFFGNYDGGKLNIVVDENVPNMKIGICTYEPVEVTFSGPFVNNITDVYYAGTNSSANNNNCGFPITTTSFVGVNPALTTLDVIPPVNIISPPNPANIANLPNGNNFGVVTVVSCDVNTYQGGGNTIDQVVDVFQTRFGGSLRGLKVQYCCWSDTLPYRLSNVTGSCCNTAPGIATLSYPPGPFCGGSGQVSPILLGDSSGIFFANPSGLIIDPATGVVNLSGSNPGTYEISYALTENCITNLYKDTILIGPGNNSATSISATTCSSYAAPWGTVYTQSGTYIDTLTTVNGCDSIINLNLTITGTIVTPPISANACSSYTAPWGTVYTQSGTYSDTLTTLNGCDSIVSVNLTITGAIITPPITANACSSYTAPWGTVYTQSGTYSDTLTTAAGCDSIVSVNLNITGNPGFIPSTTADSCGNQTGTATLLGSGGTGPYSFAWSNGATGTILTNLSAGSYTVTITDQNGCSFDSVFSIPLLAPSPISLNIASISIVEGDSVQLNVSGANVYQWTPATGLSCSNCPNPIAAPLQTITYTVTGTDNNGCRTNATVFISVDIRCIELFIPTIFSPNNSGPGVNERICIYSNCIAELDFAIYDRWGKTIFQTNDPQQCWDGTKDGKQVMTGTYTYRLAARLLNGTNVNKSGNITLTR